MIEITIRKSNKWITYYENFITDRPDVVEISLNKFLKRLKPEEQNAIITFGKIIYNIAQHGTK